MIKVQKERCNIVCTGKCIRAHDFAFICTDSLAEAQSVSLHAADESPVQSPAVSPELSVHVTSSEVNESTTATQVISTAEPCSLIEAKHEVSAAIP